MQLAPVRMGTQQSWAVGNPQANVKRVGFEPAPMPQPKGQQQSGRTQVGLFADQATSQSWGVGSTLPKSKQPQTAHREPVVHMSPSGDKVIFSRAVQKAPDAKTVSTVQTKDLQELKAEIQGLERQLARALYNRLKEMAVLLACLKQDGTFTLEKNTAPHKEGAQLAQQLLGGTQAFAKHNPQLEQAFLSGTLNHVEQLEMLVRQGNLADALVEYALDDKPDFALILMQNPTSSALGISYLLYEGYTNTIYRYATQLSQSLSKFTELSQGQTHDFELSFTLNQLNLSGVL